MGNELDEVQFSTPWKEPEQGGLLGCFTPSFSSAMIPKNILSGFRKTGISPYDPSAISIESLMPSQVTEKGDGEITLHPFIDFLH